MQITLSGKAAEIVKEKVTTGGYTDANAFISDIILRAEEFEQLKLERLRKAVKSGLDEIERGDVVEFDIEDILNTENRK